MCDPRASCPLTAKNTFLSFSSEQRFIVLYHRGDTSDICNVIEFGLDLGSLIVTTCLLVVNCWVSFCNIVQSSSYNAK